MSDMEVRIADYNPQWIDCFVEQRDAVAEALRPWLAAAVEHVGSTSVPGLPAKPIVDVLAPVADLDDREAMVEALSRRGWLYWPDDPHADSRLWFLRPDPARRTHHLHVVAHGHPREQAVIAFRDALRRDRELAAEYADLKETLAREHRHDRDAYTNGKASFVARVLAARGMPEAELGRLPE